MPKISVIVPIYNVENIILRECIESIIKSTLKDIEIILVNDGALKDEYSICYEYQNIDNRIKIINQKNQGVSIARNKGLEKASGEWIAFVDADDWIENTMYVDF